MAFSKDMRRKIIIMIVIVFGLGLVAYPLLYSPSEPEVIPGKANLEPE